MDINGIKVSWDEISREQLKYLVVDKDMSIASIAREFGVTKSQVRYKKDKFKLTRAEVAFDKFAAGDKELVGYLNENIKSRFLDYGNIGIISKAMTSYILRNGPLENLHAEKKPVTDKDMKEINIYTANHIAGLLTYVLDGNWMKLGMLMDYCRQWTIGWDSVEPETTEIDAICAIATNLMRHNKDSE